jgi:hypothetical protein
MTSFLKKYSDNNKGKKFLVLVVFAIFSNFSALAQTPVVSPSFDITTDVANISTTDVPVKTISASTINSNVSFILWFMGTKENPNKNITSPDRMCTKKGIISSGAEPNHLLIRTLLKKTVNSKFC